MSKNWVKATLAEDDPAVTSEDAREGDDVFINIGLAGLIYRRAEKKGSYVWFSADVRDAATAQLTKWQGYVSVREKPETLLGTE